MEFHLRATGRHLPYGITQCYLPPDTSERAPSSPQPVSRYSIYLPRTDGRLSWRWVDLGYPAMHRPGTELAISPSLVWRPTTALTEHCEQYCPKNRHFSSLLDNKQSSTGLPTLNLCIVFVLYCEGSCEKLRGWSRNYSMWLHVKSSYCINVWRILWEVTLMISSVSSVNISKQWGSVKQFSSAVRTMFHLN